MPWTAMMLWGWRVRGDEEERRREARADILDLRIWAGGVKFLQPENLLARFPRFHRAVVS